MTLVRRWCRAVATRPQWFLAALVALPLIVTLISALLTHWYPTGDFAQTELNVRAIPSHLPTIGVAGRFGPFDNQHSHPGPSMAYLLWPIYRLLGGTAAALLVSTVALHMAALVGSVFVAARIGGRSLAVAAAVGALLLERALGGEFFVTPWNPWMPVTAFYLFLFCVLAVSIGAWRLAPLAVLAGTHAAQTHISYMVLVHGLLGVGVLAVAYRVWRQRADGRSEVRAAVTWLGAAAGVGFLMWLPPLYDQLRGSHNLSWLVHHFASPCDPRWGGTCEPSVGLRAASKAMASELNPGGAWLSGATHNPATHAPSIVGLLMVAVAVSAAVVATIRRRDGVVLTALVQVGALAVLAVVSASRIIGDFYDYVIRWSWPAAAFGAVIVSWALWRAAHFRWVSGRPAPASVGRALVLAAAVSLVGMVTTVQALGTHPPYLQESKLVGGLASGLAGLQHDQHYVLRWHDPAGLGGVGFGLLLELDRHGFNVSTDTWTRYAVLPYRVTDEAHADQVLWVIVGTKNIEAFALRSSAKLLVRFDPRTPAQAALSDQARALIERRLTELGRQDLLDRIDGQFGNAALIAAGSTLPIDVNRAVGRYTDLRLPAAVFVEPTGQPPFAGG